VASVKIDQVWVDGVALTTGSPYMIDSSKAKVKFGQTYVPAILHHHPHTAAAAAAPRVECRVSLGQGAADPNVPNAQISANMWSAEFDIPTLSDLQIPGARVRVLAQLFSDTTPVDCDSVIIQFV
jgi:hypothetical protein